MQLAHVPDFVGIALLISLVAGLMGGWLVRDKAAVKSDRQSEED